MMDPIILFFILGVTAGLLKSELRLPPAVYDFVSIMLLLAIGLKGGIELAKQPFLEILPQMVAVVVMGFLLPLVAFPLLRYIGRLERADAASIAAHYGSVSVGTFAVAVAYLASHDIPAEEYMALFVVLLEMPAILIGILLARGLQNDTGWGEMAHEVFLGKGVVLLTGGLLIGWISGPEQIMPIAPLFMDLFKGFLALFLLEMGLIAASQMGSLRKSGLFLLFFGTGFPLFGAMVGGVLGWILGLSMGGGILLAVLAASASYIAVPAAMRMTVPEANPTLSLSASLGVTFPFNIIIGVPLYHQVAERLYPIGV